MKYEDLVRAKLRVDLIQNPKDFDYNVYKLVETMANYLIERDRPVDQKMENFGE